jgi:hypothetical protein
MLTLSLGGVCELVLLPFFCCEKNNHFSNGGGIISNKWTLIRQKAEDKAKIH